MGHGLVPIPGRRSEAPAQAVRYLGVGANRRSQAE